MSERNKPGTLNVIYFVHADNKRITLAPYTSFPTPYNHTREVANTLGEVSVLQRRLQEQERRDMEREYIQSESKMEALSQVIRDRLYARMASSATTEYERDYIRAWLELKDEKKRARYAEIFHLRQHYLWALEFDSARNRRSDEERVNTERITVPS